VKEFGSNARLGTSDWMVTEADESDRSFLMLSPTVAVVTNIDREHMDYYHDMTDVLECFQNFVNKVPFFGAAVLCLDDPNVQAVIPKIKRRRITYGLSAQADVSAHAINFDNNFGSSFDVWLGTEVLGRVSLPVPGRHNVYNALASISVGLELGIEFQKITTALSKFSNADRRFQFKGEVNDIIIVDDYGHHPTEVQATLAAAKYGSGLRRTVVLFQPHRYSRTHDLMDDFARSFNNADVLFVTDIYAASEDPIEDVTAEVLTEKIRQYGHKNAHYIGALEGAAEKVAAILQSNDLVITLGAGSVSRASEQILEVLRDDSSNKAISGND
jgi:UDP-N-acetylmuramate--alanine ligase